MVWRDVSFRLLSHFATSNQGNCLNNAVLGQTVIDGYVTMQVLAIRRLMDNRNSDVVSLRKLTKDIRRNFHLFTRENFVCFDGLPYDYDAVYQRKVLRADRVGIFWDETSPVIVYPLTTNIA